MRLYFPVDLTGHLIMIEKLVLGEIWTGDLPIFNPDALTSVPSWQEWIHVWSNEELPWHDDLHPNAWQIIFLKSNLYPRKSLICTFINLA